MHVSAAWLSSIMHHSRFLVFFLALLLVSHSKVYIHEQFDQGFENRWTYSDDTSVTHGVFHVVEKKFCDNGDTAIKSMNDSSYYHLSSRLDGVLNTREKDLYFQYVVQYEQDIDCGGAYIKLFSDLEPKSLTGNSPYSVMIGPDVCGYGTKTIHFILSHNGNNYQLKDKVNFETDTHPHLVSLFIGTDKKFSLKIDEKIKKEGKLSEHFEYLLPEKIDDPQDHKPEDWEDSPTMDDPNDVKPEDWDDRKEIPDPDAKKPENWDEATDGEWEADSIKNPAYKGEWSPKQISNPKYKGVWAPKQIPNPDYKDDNTFADFDLQYVGFDLWTVKSGTIFDEIYMTDDKTEAEEHEHDVMEALKVVVEKIKKEEAAKPKPEGPIIGGEDDKDESGDADSEEPEDSEESKDQHEDL